MARASFPRRSLRRATNPLLEAVRTRVASAAAEPFGHSDPPLVDTLDHPGDPGLFGPGSVTWQVMGRATTFIGGIRGLLVQACHPEVVAGVHDHSRYRDDPLGRLSRTAFYVTATAFGAMPEVEQAVQLVRGRHRPVVGESHRGRRYDAGDPGLAAWVHNALTDSFLATHMAYSPHDLGPGGPDRFVDEQRALGALLDADPLPDTSAGLSSWLADHPDVAPSPGMAEAVAFLRNPPLSPGQRAGYRVLFAAAVATLPARLREVLDLADPVMGAPAGHVSSRLLSWGLGDSPAWQVALLRTGAAQDVGDFRRPMRREAVER